jgi:hypothetical protein
VKLRLVEDFEGEIAGLSDADLAAKLVAGMTAIANHAYADRRQRLAIEKGGTGGEIDALENVLSEISAGFSKALEKIRKDALDGLTE